MSTTDPLDELLTHVKGIREENQALKKRVATLLVAIDKLAELGHGTQRLVRPSEPVELITEAPEPVNDNYGIKVKYLDVDGNNQGVVLSASNPKEDVDNVLGQLEQGFRDNDVKPPIGDVYSYRIINPDGTFLTHWEETSWRNEPKEAN